MNIKLDDTDLKIIEILQEDARITTKALASKLSLTTTPVFERVKRLERENIIDKYVALLNPRKVGLQLTALIFISIKDHARSYLENFIKEVSKYDEVMECYHIAGNFDFQLKVVVKDMEAYERFILTKLSVNSNLAHVQSCFVLSQNKHSTAYKISNL